MLPLRYAVHRTTPRGLAGVVLTHYPLSFCNPNAHPSPTPTFTRTQAGPALLHMRRQEGGRVVQPDPARQRKVSLPPRVPYTLSSPHTRAARLTMAVLTHPRCLCFKQYAAFPPAKPILCAVCCVQRGRASRSRTAYVTPPLPAARQHLHEA